MENDWYKKVLRPGVATARYGPDQRYERINRDAALRVAEAAVEAGVPAMLFVSAAGAPPGVNSRFPQQQAL